MCQVIFFVRIKLVMSTDREKYKRLRSELNKEQKDEATKIVVDKILKLLKRDYRSKSIILCYYALDDELDLKPLYETLLQNDYHLYFPKTDGKTMEFYRVKDLDSFTAGQFNIMEPSDLSIVYDRHLSGDTFVIVPGVAFDHKMNRIGHGMGYYDRFLRSNKMSSAIKCGVCYSVQMADHLEVFDHDVPMDILIHD